MDFLISRYIKDPIFKVVAAEASKLGVPVYVIGGYVRDMFLGRPCKDIDFVTVGDGPKLASAVAAALGKAGSAEIHGNFGTAVIRYEGFELEFVGARKESYRYDSRKPDVMPGTLQDDLNRRDFTVNTLAISLNKENYGKLIDTFHGMRDLESGVLRTPLNPGITYSDDPLRMMRAIRFSSQLDFKIDEASLLAIHENAERIKIVSKERVVNELNKIMLSDRPSKGFKLLMNTGLLEIIFPEMCALKGAEYIDGKGHKDNFYHTLQVLDNLCKNTEDLWLRWSAVMHDIAKPLTKKFEPGHGWTFHGHEELGARITPRIFKNLGLPQNDKMKYVQKLVRLHLRPIALAKEEISDSAIRRLIFDAGDDLDDLLMLCEADITSKNEEKVKKYLRNYKKVREKIVELEERDRIRNFQPPVSGEEIMGTFGLQPCEEVGMIKNAIKDAILDGIIRNDAAEAKVFMVNKGIELGLKVANG